MNVHITEKSNFPSSQYCHRPGPEAGGFAGSGTPSHNEASARAQSRVFTEAGSEATVIIKDLRNSIHFPKGFREPLLSTRRFMKLAGCTAALLHRAGAHTSATRLASAPVLSTARGVGDGSVTCGANLPLLLRFSQYGCGKGRKTEWFEVQG